ncbi:hypothetical protein ABT095_13025 [Kitasatospora sp. NPDC002227]|uniref:hypothetical protein n=1 Tax=Kitasatospora sp. NPDC002227 TaxID=3154773 RepID=UPI00331A2926
MTEFDGRGTGGRMTGLAGWVLTAVLNGVLRALMVARALSTKLATSLRFPHEY